MDNPVGFLRWAGLLHASGSLCLDVGIRDGKYARQFVGVGYEVHAIDINPMPELIPGVAFEQIRLEDFRPRQKYSLVFARNVLQATDDPLMTVKKLIDLLDLKGILYVTFFGLEDPWVRSGKVKGVTYEDAYAALKDLTLHHYGTYHQRGPALTGEVKLWHIHTFVCGRPK